MPKSELILTPEHKYYLNGNRVYGVSEIIDSVFPFEGGGIVAQRAADFGKAVHQAVSLEIKGIIDPSTIDPAIQPFLNQFWKFLIEYNLLTTQCQTEVMLYSKKYGFCGTPDIIEKDIIDIKTGQKHPKHRLQISSYRKLWNENNPKDKKDKGLIIYLNGSDKPPEIVEEQQGDFSVFLALLEIKKFKELERL